MPAGTAPCPRYGLELIRSMPHPRTAIILAAGSGSRLLPHTAHAPKCLTPSPVSRSSATRSPRFASAAISDIVIVVGYKSDWIREFVDSSVHAR